MCGAGTRLLAEQGDAFTGRALRVAYPLLHGASGLELDLRRLLGLPAALHSVISFPAGCLQVGPVAGHLALGKFYGAFE